MQEVLDFWFPLGASADEILERNMKRGYMLDVTIRFHFSGVLRSAENGDLSHWCNCPDGILALVIVLDQFSRHAYRNTPQAYANDMAAKMVLKWALAVNPDLTTEYTAIENIFLLMPLQHSTLFEDQTAGIRMLTMLHTAATTEQEVLGKALQHQQGHMTVVKKFGKFPLRERQPTSEDEAFHIKQSDELGLHY